MGKKSWVQNCKTVEEAEQIINEMRSRHPDWIEQGCDWQIGNSTLGGGVGIYFYDPTIKES